MSVSVAIDQDVEFHQYSTNKVYNKLEYTYKKSGNSKKKCFILMVAVLLVSTVISICAAVFLFSSKEIESDAHSKTPCLTAECQETATSLLRDINFQVDPCDDFYEFTCGTWVKNHSR